MCYCETRNRQVQLRCGRKHTCLSQALLAIVALNVQLSRTCMVPVARHTTPFSAGSAERRKRCQRTSKVRDAPPADHDARAMKVPAQDVHVDGTHGSRVLTSGGLSLRSVALQSNTDLPYHRIPYHKVKGTSRTRRIGLDGSTVKGKSSYDKTFRRRVKLLADIEADTTGTRRISFYDDSMAHPEYQGLWIRAVVVHVENPPYSMANPAQGPYVVSVGRGIECECDWFRTEGKPNGRDCEHIWLAKVKFWGGQYDPSFAKRKMTNTVGSDIYNMLTNHTLTARECDLLQRVSADQVGQSRVQMQCALDRPPTHASRTTHYSGVHSAKTNDILLRSNRKRSSLRALRLLATTTQGQKIRRRQSRPLFALLRCKPLHTCSGHHVSPQRTRYHGPRQAMALGYARTGSSIEVNQRGSG